MSPIKTIIIFLVAMISAFGNSNIEKIHYSFSLSRVNRANVVRLCNDQKVVRYIFEVWLDGGEIDSPDDQLGGSLCIRINQAGGQYIPGCLLCRENAIKNYNSVGCYGIFSQEMLIESFNQAKMGIPIKYVGHGMIIKITIKNLNFADQIASDDNNQKVKDLSFDLDIQPTLDIPESQAFKRVS